MTAVIRLMSLTDLCTKLSFIRFTKEGVLYTEVELHVNFASDDSVKRESLGRSFGCNIHTSFDKDLQ